MALDFARKHNVQVNSADGRRIILGFCIKCIQQLYKNTNSLYPKIICIGKKAISKRVSFFIDNYFENILNQMPIPYCGQIDIDSPDLEYAAENSLKQYKPQRKFLDIASRLKLKDVKSLIKTSPPPQA